MLPYIGMSGPTRTLCQLYIEAFCECTGMEVHTRTDRGGCAAPPWIYPTHPADADASVRACFKDNLKEFAKHKAKKVEFGSIVSTLGGSMVPYANSRLCVGGSV